MNFLVEYFDTLHHSFVDKHRRGSVPIYLTYTREQTRYLSMHRF